MIHARTDYDPIQDPRKGGIGENEPVFLLRAKDPYFVAMIAHYIEINESGNKHGQKRISTSLARHIIRALDWRDSNADPLKRWPDMPIGTERKEER